MTDKQPKKVKPRRRIVDSDAAQRGVNASVLKEKQRRQEQLATPDIEEMVNPHYSLHLHIAWDVGMVTPYLDQWKLEQTLYHHVLQMERFVVHRQDFIKRSGGADASESWTICSIEFHDAAISIPVRELVNYGDPFKLLTSLGVDVPGVLKWPGS